MDSQDRLARLTTERTRIAADLHDTVASRLYLLLIKLEQMPGLEPEQTKGERELVKDIIGHMELIVRNLNDKKIGRLGLQLSLEALILQHRTIDKALPEIYFRYEVKEPICEFITYSIYKMVQELLHNTLRHAGAT